MYSYYHNGKVNCEVSLGILNKPLRHDFAPLHRFAKKQMMYFEVQRLFLDYRRQPDGKMKIVLDNMQEE